MVIQVLLRDPRSGSETKYELDQSPVRIGRNQLNNVVLDGNFVSGWHGTIRFDNTGTYYFDLGSTNGTCIDGKRLPKNTAIPLQQTTRLTIWMYELVVTPGVPGGLAEAPARKTNAGTLVGAGGGTESLRERGKGAGCVRHSRHGDQRRRTVRPRAYSAAADGRAGQANLARGRARPARRTDRESTGPLPAHHRSIHGRLHRVEKGIRTVWFRGRRAAPERKHALAPRAHQPGDH